MLKVPAPGVIETGMGISWLNVALDAWDGDVFGFGSTTVALENDADVKSQAHSGRMSVLTLSNLILPLLQDSITDSLVISAQVG